MGTLITWTLDGTFLVRGQVTGFEYEDLPGVVVTVKNERTGNSKTYTVEDAGDYEADVGNVTDFPAGYASGDEFTISVTHRSTTRSWKRRLSGSEIVQDLHFTHGTYLGALRKAKMAVVDRVTGQTGATVTLRDSTTFDIVQVKKNGELLDSTAWTFTAPATLTVTAPLTSSDVLEVERAVHRSIGDAKDRVVKVGDSEVRDATARLWTSPQGTRIPELQDVSEALAAAALRHELFSGGGRADADAERLEKTARSRLEAIREGKMSLTDQDGSYVTPAAKTVTTPQSSKAPTRRFSTFDVDKVNLLD